MRWFNLSNMAQLYRGHESILVNLEVIILVELISYLDFLIRVIFRGVEKTEQEKEITQQHR